MSMNILSKSFIQFILNKDISDLNLSELFEWGKQNGLTGELLSWCPKNFEFLDGAGEPKLFGALDSEKIDLCIMPISWGSPEALASQFEETLEEIEPLFSEKGLLGPELNHADIKAAKWALGLGAIWLYQDARDPQNGSELSISFRSCANASAY